MIIIFFFIFLFALFSFGVFALYHIGKLWRYRTTVHVWLAAFILEVGGLLFIKEHYVPWLNLTIRNGFYYLIDLVFNTGETMTKLLHGHYPDLALVLALPLLPALGGFWYDRRRYRQRLGA